MSRLRTKSRCVNRLNSTPEKYAAKKEEIYYRVGMKMERKTNQTSKRKGNRNEMKIFDFIKYMDTYRGQM